MEQKEIQQLINQTLDQRQQANTFGVSLIPAHAHTGADSLPINPNDLINFALYAQVRQVTLSSVQIKALHTTPITLVPALGNGATAANPNSVIIVEGITAKIYAGGTAFTGANNLEFRYTDASGIKVTADMASTFINTTANTQAYDHVAGIITEFTPVFNSPIVVSVPTASPGAGNGTITFSVKYRVIML